MSAATDKCPVHYKCQRSEHVNNVTQLQLQWTMTLLCAETWLLEGHFDRGRGGMDAERDSYNTKPRGRQGATLKPRVASRITHRSLIIFCSIIAPRCRVKPPPLSSWKYINNHSSEKRKMMRRRKVEHTSTAVFSFFPYSQQWKAAKRILQKQRRRGSC
jgi:hypothetical protein